MAAPNKTMPTNVPVAEFLATVPSERRREEGHTLVALMSRVTGEPAVMWGPSIVGFGELHYRYESGREGDTAIVGFSPRKAAISLYGLHNADGSTALLGELGPHKTGAGCVYVTSLARIDLGVLERLIALNWANPPRFD